MLGLKTIVNVINGLPITLEESLNNSYLFLKYTVGNVNADVLMYLMNRDVLKPSVKELINTGYHIINTDLIALELSIKPIDVMKSLTSLSKSGFIRVLKYEEVGFKELYVSIEPKRIKGFIINKATELLSKIDNDDILGVEVNVRSRDTNKVSNKETGLWIALNIKYATDLSSDEKIIIAEIVSLHNSTSTGVYKGNNSYAKLINKSISTTGKIIRSLKDKGYLKDENRLIYSDPTTVQKRYLIPTFYSITGRESNKVLKESDVSRVNIESKVSKIEMLKEKRIKESDVGYTILPF